MEWLLVGIAAAALLLYRTMVSRRGSANLQRDDTSPPPAPPHRSGRQAAEARSDASTQSYSAGPPDHRASRVADGPRVSATRSTEGTQGRWVAFGETVTVAGIRIDSGMFYLGEVLAAPNSGRIDNCLINPSLAVTASGSDPDGRSMPYWPAYSGIPPVARRTYLQWLAGGRNDPAIGIGYVFLFFYGLERRLFVDSAKAEAGAVIAEVQRLVKLHGASGSFRSYASRLLDAARLMQAVEVGRPEPSPDLRNGYEMPLSVRAHLGSRLASRAPFDATDALLWVLSLPDTALRTPATRCFEELVLLWDVRFARRHGAGLKVAVPRTKLKIEYRAASGTFNCKMELSDLSGALPDVAAVSAPLKGLRDMLLACTDDLDAYSRLLGKKPEARGTIEAALLLPTELIESASGPVAAVRQNLYALFGGRAVAELGVRGLLHLLGIEISATGKLPTTLCIQVGTLLDKLDVGFEPDRRHGSRNLSAKGRVVIFKVEGGGRVDSKEDAYSSARILIEIAVLAAAADGRVDPAEREAVNANVRAFPGLADAERARLMAYAHVLLTDVDAQRSALQRMRRLRPELRDGATRAALSAMLADGHAGPDEVKFLERLYKAMGHPVEDVYSALHRGGLVVDEPVPVMPETRTAGIPIPASEHGRREGLRIDAARLERIRSETSAVSGLLAGIFAEDLPAIPEPAQVVRPPGTEGFEGLDGRHAALLASVLAAGTMDRSGFDGEARRLRLLSGGAIETINEWGFDRFDEPVIEGDDPIAVPGHVRAELERMRTAA